MKTVFYKPALLLVCALMLSGCINAGGKVARVLSGGNNIKGQLQDGVYRDRNNHFEVATPFPPDHPYYKKMFIKENELPGSTYVSFSYPFHYNFYRLEVVPASGTSLAAMPLDLVVDQVVSAYVKHIGVDGGEMKPLQRFNTTLNGRPAVVVTLKQYAPSQGRSDRLFASYHIVTVLKDPEGLATLTLEVGERCAACEYGNVEDILKAFPPYWRLVNSFRFVASQPSEGQ